MKGFRSKLDDLLDELERLTLEEKEFHPDWTEFVENLPEFGEEVLVTDGANVWIDSFDVDDFVYLSGTDDDIDGVIAWMELQEPYKEEQK